MLWSYDKLCRMLSGTLLWATAFPGIQDKVRMRFVSIVVLINEAFVCKVSQAVRRCNPVAEDVTCHGTTTALGVYADSL